MKRVPPYVGFAILEKEDVEQLTHEQRMAFIRVYAVVIGLSLGVIAHGVWTVML